MFTIDESGYAQIVQQVRDSEFTKELERRKTELEAHKQDEIRLASVNKDAEIAGLKNDIEALKAEKENNRLAQELAVSQAVQKKNNEMLKLKEDMEALRAEIKNSEIAQELAVAKAVQEKKDEILKLTMDNANMKQQHATELKAKDEMIAQYKDMKIKMSTKMIGESLEQHCMNEFNNIRMTAFPHAYFEKDNDAREGSKGDFIFREADSDGIEFISIMFEMKNEMDETASKHKNEDFFKKLDKDRRDKGCEYAVLVSLLEKDNEFYNNGIVDVSYKYEKMYVIRPQFFIPIITLLRNASLKSLEYKRELVEIRNQQLDLSRFEENLMDFKERFSKNYTSATKSFTKAIEEIDKSIDHMQKIKDSLLASLKQLGYANNKAEDLTIRKLTKGAPIAEAMFEALKDDKK